MSLFTPSLNKSGNWPHTTLTRRVSLYQYDLSMSELSNFLKVASLFLDSPVQGLFSDEELSVLKMCRDSLHDAYNGTTNGNTLYVSE